MGSSKKKVKPQELDSSPQIIASNADESTIFLDSGRSKKQRRASTFYKSLVAGGSKPEGSGQAEQSSSSPPVVDPDGDSGDDPEVYEDSEQSRLDPDDTLCTEGCGRDMCDDKFRAGVCNGDCEKDDDEDEGGTDNDQDVSDSHTTDDEEEEQPVTRPKATHQEASLRDHPSLEPAPVPFPAPGVTKQPAPHAQAPPQPFWFPIEMPSTEMEATFYSEKVKLFRRLAATHESQGRRDQMIKLLDQADEWEMKVLEAMFNGARDDYYKRKREAQTTGLASKKARRA